MNDLNYRMADALVPPPFWDGGGAPHAVANMTGIIWKCSWAKPTIDMGKALVLLGNC